MNQLRVSIATSNQVIFPHPENGTLMLALERKATVLKDGNVNVRAQPFGGGVKILNPQSLKQIIGEIQFDSDRSKQEQDFRILIEPARWEAVKQYCLKHLDDPADFELESTPDRELVEEFAETLGLGLKSSQYTVQPLGWVIAHSGENDHSFRLMPITQSDASRSPNPLDGDQLGRRPFGAERSDADRSMIHASADQDKGVRVLRMDSPFSSRRWA